MEGTQAPGAEWLNRSLRKTNPAKLGLGQILHRKTCTSMQLRGKTRGVFNYLGVVGESFVFCVTLTAFLLFPPTMSLYHFIQTENRKVLSVWGHGERQREEDGEMEG